MKKSDRKYLEFTLIVVVNTCVFVAPMITPTYSDFGNALGYFFSVLSACSLFFLKQIDISILPSQSGVKSSNAMLGVGLTAVTNFALSGLSPWFLGYTSGPLEGCVGALPYLAAHYGIAVLFIFAVFWFSRTSLKARTCHFDLALTMEKCLIVPMLFTPTGTVYYLLSTSHSFTDQQVLFFYLPLQFFIAAIVVGYLVLWLPSMVRGLTQKSLLEIVDIHYLGMIVIVVLYCFGIFSSDNDKDYHILSGFLYMILYFLMYYCTFQLVMTCYHWMRRNLQPNNKFGRDNHDRS